MMILTRRTTTIFERGFGMPLRAKFALLLSWYCLRPQLRRPITFWAISLAMKILSLDRPATDRGGSADVVVVRRGAPKRRLPGSPGSDEGLITGARRRVRARCIFRFQTECETGRGVEPRKTFAIPKLSIVWEQMLEMPVYQLPAAGARVYGGALGICAARGRLQAGKGCGALGSSKSRRVKAIERFPYLFHALSDLGDADHRYRFARVAGLL